MTTFLLVEDTYEGRREFFKTSDVAQATCLLIDWVSQNKNRDVFLFEVGPGIETQITSGFELFKSDMTLAQKILPEQIPIKKEGNENVTVATV